MMSLSDGTCDIIYVFGWAWCVDGVHSLYNVHPYCDGTAPPTRIFDHLGIASAYICSEFRAQSSFVSRDSSETFRGILAEDQTGGLGEHWNHLSASVSDDAIWLSVLTLDHGRLLSAQEFLSGLSFRDLVRFASESPIEASLVSGWVRTGVFHRTVRSLARALRSVVGYGLPGALIPAAWLPFANSQLFTVLSVTLFELAESMSERMAKQGPEWMSTLVICAAVLCGGPLAARFLCRELVNSAFALGECELVMGAIYVSIALKISRQKGAVAPCVRVDAGVDHCVHSRCDRVGKRPGGGRGVWPGCHGGGGSRGRAT
jgi:hypothetical protein